MSEPLPDLLQSDIDEPTLAQLITDVGSLTELHEVIPKYGPGYVGEPAPLQLDEAYRGLVDGTLKGLQLRYRHDGKTWWDTIMPMPENRFRIVRIEHQFD